MRWKLILLLIAAVTEAAPGTIERLTSRWSLHATKVNDITRRAVEVVQQVVQGPARQRSVTLHLDPAVPGAAQDAILKLQPLHFPSIASPLHLVIYISLAHFPIDLLSKAVLPSRHLLLLNMGTDYNATTLLLQPPLSSVHSLALLTPLPGEPGSLAVYTLLPFCSPLPHFLGRWSSHIFPTWMSLFPDRFPTTCQATYRLATWINDAPFLYRRLIDNKTTGVSVNMLEVMATRLNFSYSMTEKPEDSKWGAVENGEWVGLLGMVNSGEYDFTVNSLFNSEERSVAFDEAEPIWQEYVTVFLKNPAPLPEWMNLVRTFPPDVWGLLVAAFILSSCCFILQAKMSERRWSDFLHLVRAIVSQSAPRSSQPKLYAANWLLFCLVITAAFTSNLVGIFTKPAFPLRLTSLSQLTNSDKRLTILDHGSLLSDMFKRGEHPFLRTISPRTDLYLEEAKAVEAMEAGTHGYMASITFTSLALINTFKVRDWYLLKESFFSVRQQWFFKKHTPWKERFDKYIRTQVEAGLLGHWYKTELRALGYSDEGERRAEGGQSGEGAGQPLNTRHLQGLFSLLGGALAVSIVVFLLEMTQRPLCCSRSLPGSSPA